MRFVRPPLIMALATPATHVPGGSTEVTEDMGAWGYAHFSEWLKVAKAVIEAEKVQLNHLSWIFSSGFWLLSRTSSIPRTFVASGVTNVLQE
jgi:hypothetical protein